MLRIEDTPKIILFKGITDFRLGINGLSLKVYTAYGQADLENTLFVFCSKSKKQIKILEFDKTGVWLYTKKTNKFKFSYPSGEGKMDISSDEFKSLFEVINIMIKGEDTGTQFTYNY